MGTQSSTKAVNSYPWKIANEVIRSKDAFSSLAIPILAFMASWVLIYPASYWVGWWPGYEARMESLAAQPHMPVPRDALTKYAPHADVKLTHILPSGLWSVCGVLQLLPGLRSTWPLLHRLSGRLMLICSALITIGYMLIESHGLSPSLLSDAPPASIQPLVKPQSSHIVLRTIAAWFVLTGGLTLKCALSRHFAAHSRWAVRHLAAGGWVVLQRLLLMVVALGLQVAGAVLSEVQRHGLFAGAALVAILGSVIGTELYLVRGGGGRGSGQECSRTDALKKER